MKLFLRSLTIMTLAIAFAPVAAFSGEAEDLAVKTAGEWLELVDKGEYEASWEEAAALLKSVVTVEQWRQALNAARKPFGELESRELKIAEYATSLPGAPDGEYVVIQFDTSFSKKESAVETITPMKDDDGVWRVSGYYIK
jgi:hypothetical protein